MSSPGLGRAALCSQQVPEVTAAPVGPSSLGTAPHTQRAGDRLQPCGEASGRAGASRGSGGHLCAVRSWVPHSPWWGSSPAFMGHPG